MNTPPTIDEMVVGDLLAALAEPDGVPGAVAAAATAAAISAALLAGAGHGVTGAGSRLASRLVQVASVDADRYRRWLRQPDLPPVVDPPAQVAGLAHTVSALAAGALDQGGNELDLAVARLLATAAAEAARLVAVGNATASLSGRHRITTLDMHAGGRAWIPGQPTRAQPLLTAVSASGCTVIDDAGGEWLDATSGMWNVPLGHGHPIPLAAFITQAGCLAAVDPFQVATPVADTLANKLAALTGFIDGQVVIASSGSEAVETAVRLALMICGAEAPVWACPGAFHGSTAGAAQLSGFPPVYQPYPAAMRYARTAPPDQWRDGIGIAEPVLGAGGCRRLADNEVAGINRFRARGGLVIVDEVASGLGRAAWPTAHTRLGLNADMVIFGKGITNGVCPLSAVVISAPVVERLAGRPLEDGHTYSNHPAAIAAALSCLSALATIEHDGYAAGLQGALRNAGLPVVGMGCFLAVPGRASPRADVVRALRQARLICHIPTSGADCTQLIVAPPLTMTDTERDELADRLARAVAMLGWPTGRPQ